MQVAGKDLLLFSDLVFSKSEALTPGSVTEACQNDEKQITNKYANKIGIAGLTLIHNQGALKAS
jgi:hypothetical protein